MNQIHEILLEQIRPAPWNPISRMDPAKVKELATSIKREGQKSAALVRPVGAEAPIKYELVFGHRRHAARQLLGHKVLRAEIEEMDEEQAIIVSGIENLQRENPSDIEEADYFQTCAERYGDSAVKILSEKLSVSQPYVRKRIEFLKLPEPALQLWRSGTWHVGHMEQLLRLGGNEKVLEFLENIPRWQKLSELRVSGLREMIDRQAVSLKDAHFDKAECKKCHKNTDCQRRLFGTESDKGKCLDPECFTRKLQAWLDVHWAESKANEHGTQTAIIGNNDYGVTGKFTSYDYEAKAGEKCRSCSHYATIVGLDGKTRSWNLGQVCLGEAACFAEVKKASAKQSSSGKTGETDPDAPRVPWHGEYFRQQFYQQEIPGLMAKLDQDDPRHLQLALATMLYSARTLHEWFCEQIGQTKLMEEVKAGRESWQYFRLPFYQLLALSQTIEAHQVKKLLAETLVKTALRTDSGYDITFTDQDRQALAEFLDIDWSRFQVNEEYLNKKTKAEVIRFIAKDSRLMVDQDFLRYIKARGWENAEKLAALKKGQLVDLVLKCEVDLHGRLPKEIADRPVLQAPEVIEEREVVNG